MRFRHQYNAFAAAVSFATLAAASALPARAIAGGPTLADVLAGKAAPLTLTLKEMDGGQWRRMNVTLPADAAMTGPGAMEKALSAALGGPSASTYYTRGQVISIDGQSFLIAYRPRTEPVNLTDPKPTKLTADTPVTMSLIALRTATAFEDIRPFKLSDEIAAQEQATRTVASMVLAPETPAEENLRQIGLAVLMYAQDHDDVLPTMKDTEAVRTSLASYVPDATLFRHPGTGEAFVPNPVLGGKKFAHIPSPESMVAFFEAAPAEDGTRAVLFLDGNVRRVSDEDWPKLARACKIAWNR